MALLLLAKGANWGLTRSTVRVSKRRGISIMKIIIMVTAAFFAMLSVAAAADLPIGKYPVGAAARPAPARPAALGPGERGGGRVAPEGPVGGEVTGGRAPVAPEQSERPIAEGAGEKPPAGVAHGEEREAGGGGAPEHNLQPPAGGQPDAKAGGE
jgi:hypothetical protein